MPKLQNQEGVALITALMFTLLCLGMIMTLLYYVSAGTRMSAAQKRYRNSLEASYGGTEFITRTIIPRVFSNTTTGTGQLLAAFGASDRLGLAFPSDKIGLKIQKGTDDWGAGVSKTPNAKEAPDVVFTLKGQNGGTNFKVYTKIVDTVPGVGLMDASGIDYLDAGMGVAGTNNSTQTPRTPNIYSIEVQGEAAVNPKEKAALSVLYAY